MNRRGNLFTVQVRATILAKAEGITAGDGCTECPQIIPEGTAASVATVGMPVTRPTGSPTAVTHRRLPQKVLGFPWREHVQGRGCVGTISARQAAFRPPQRSGTLSALVGLGSHAPSGIPSAPVDAQTVWNSDAYCAVPAHSRKTPARSSRAIKTSSGTSYAYRIPYRLAGTNPKRG
jgi:hypothetical protein